VSNQGNKNPEKRVYKKVIITLKFTGTTLKDLLITGERISSSIGSFRNIKKIYS
jgi:hypothetical protein